MLAGVCTVALVALAACSGGGSSSSGNTTITLASQRNTTGLPVWLANKLGYFKQNGLKVKIKYYASGAPAVEAGLNGDWQAGWLGAPPALTADKWHLVTSGLEIEEGKNQVMMVRKSDLKGKTPKQLVKGGQALVVVNSTSQQVLNACLNKFGLSPSDVKVVPLEPPAVVQAFQSGRGTVAMSWTEPSFQLLNKPKKYTKICDGNQAGVKVYSVFVIHPDFWKDHRNQAAAYVDAVYRADKFIKDHPNKAAHYLTEFYKTIGLKYGLKDAKKALALRHWYTLDETIKAYENGQAKNGLGATAGFFVKNKVWQESPNVDEIVSSGLKALKAGKKYQEQHGR